MTYRTSAEIFWSDEDRGWIATDKLRPGCSAFGITEQASLRELQNARRAWDEARAMANGEVAREGER